MKLQNPWFIATVVAAFASFISFAMINTVFGDKHDFNGIFGFLGLGIVLAIAAIFFLYKTAATSTGQGG